ncbi:MAG TPA: hypothetical protein DEP84_14475 [Chloroflexi bacterium]|nr:hypothetical protein [Chloroflexota bacterium]
MRDCCGSILLPDSHVKVEGVAAITIDVAGDEDVGAIETDDKGRNDASIGGNIPATMEAEFLLATKRSRADMSG